MFGRFRLLRTDSKSRPWMKNGFVILLQKFRDFCIMFCIVCLIYSSLVYVVCTKTKLDLCMQAKVKRSRVTWYDTMMFKVETNYTSYGIWDLSSLLPCLNIIHFAVCVKESVERKWESSEQTLLPSKKNFILKKLIQFDGSFKAPATLQESFFSRSFNFQREPREFGMSFCRDFSSMIFECRTWIRSWWYQKSRNNFSSARNIARMPKLKIFLSSINIYIHLERVNGGLVEKKPENVHGIFMVNSWVLVESESLDVVSDF